MLLSSSKKSLSGSAPGVLQSTLQRSVASKKSDKATSRLSDNRLPSMPGMPGSGLGQSFSAMLNKQPDDAAGAVDGQSALSMPGVGSLMKDGSQFNPGNLLHPGEMSSLPSSGKQISAESGGLKSFLRDLLLGGKNEQKPDQGIMQQMGEALARKNDNAPQGAPGGNTGLFAAMDAPLNGLTPDDIQFAGEVDAALSRRPTFGVRTLSVVVTLMFICLVIWAAFADIDEVTHAEGQVVGSQRTQTIQNLEGGILRGVQVREGQIVEKGDVLAQLDNEMAESAYRDATQKAMENSIAIIRLEDELHDRKPVFPENLRVWGARLIDREMDENTMARARQIIADQENTWQSRQNRLNSEIEVFKSQYEQRMHDMEEQMARKTQLDRSLALSIEQRDTAYALVLRNNFSRMEYLGLQQKVVEIQGQIDMLASSIPKAKAAADEYLQRIASRRAEQNSAITEEINKRRLELSSLRETLSAGSDRVTRTELRTPVRGTVKQIYINTVGGVVKPGEPIMDIVPLDDTLLVEARVTPKDVAFLRPGQDVMVKISAYDFSIYGGLEGKLESVSADTIEDKKGNYYYLAKVRTQKTAITYHNESWPIIPGMMVTADIMIGKKTVLDYLLKPILKAKQNALRER
jgi:adhesin transport system membrane fusion protein